MNLQNLISRLRGHASWNQRVETAATACAPDIWPSVSTQVYRMSAAQRYGYLRARATRQVTEVVSTQFSTRDPQQRAQTEVLHRVVEILIGYLRQTPVVNSATPAAHRRAA